LNTKKIYPELSITGIMVGYFTGALITLSIAYASLVLGFSIEGSELAAILGFGILRGILKRTSIVENNINQTLASSVNSASAGMMFSIPALFILKYTDFNPYLMVFSCISGGILGISFIIPLRKQMIDFERLTYPGGVAVATILKSPGAGTKKLKLMLSAMLISGIFYLLSHSFNFENLNLGKFLPLPAYTNLTYYVSLMTIGVAFIAGKGGLYFVIGGYLCYFILAPILDFQNILPTASFLEANNISMVAYLRSKLFMPLGIGMLIGGAIIGIIVALPQMLSVIKTMHVSSKQNKANSKYELPIKFLYISIVLASLFLFIIAYTSTSNMSIFIAISMALLGTLWIWVAGIILSECIGRTNWSPLSGMTLIAVTILIIISSGLGTKEAIIASLMVGVAVCVAMAQATDLMMDLKTGYLVGASPKKQQIAQFLGVWLGPILVMSLIFILDKAYGIGSERLPAPQGRALASMITSILGGNVPIEKYIAGISIGGLLSATGIGGLGIMVGLGFYMPFNIVLTYTIGSVLRILVDKKFGLKFSQSKGVPVAAGLIVGEALMGVFFALYYIFLGAN